MNAIQTKIKALQRQQAKIDLLQSLRSNLSGLTDPGGHEGVASEISTLLVTFIDRVISKIESGESFATSDRSGTVHLNSEESAEIQNHVEASAPVPAAPGLSVSRENKAAFALQYRGYGGKIVKGSDESGAEVKGPVIKLDAPFLVVRNDLASGALARVRPDAVSE
jgi:hypothetical protein